ncbi:hypothetical protein [Pseudomonas taeanensis]|uniref:hypothetical protein n=1 Tax=Pseudomonas taeanensis TaxID=574962 RepID=UPI00046ABC4C|nr:hypothetical protein [Pseudomonas taeanensis]
MPHRNTSKLGSELPLPPDLAALNEKLETRTRQLEERFVRLSAASNKTAKRGRKPRALDNPIVGVFSHVAATTDQRHGYPAWADDVFQGVARLDWYRANARSIPLSVKRLVRIIDHLPVISTANISTLLLLEERQARRYMTAIELALPYLLKGIPSALMQELQVGADWLDDDFDTHFGDELQLAA